VSTFTVPVELGDPQGQRFEAFTALVDTGATYTVLPSSFLERLGVQPHRTSTFEFGDGSRQEMRLGRTWIRVAGQLEMTLVVFGAEGVDPILGAVTLEECQLGVDPVKQKLIPVSGLMMSSHLASDGPS
jgi:predicted aspartyl protease